MVEGPIEPRLRLVGSEMPSQQMSGCGTNQTCQGSLTMPALEGRTDVSREAGDFRFGPKAAVVLSHVMRTCLPLTHWPWARFKLS